MELASIPPFWLTGHSGSLAYGFQTSLKPQCVISYTGTVTAQSGIARIDAHELVETAFLSPQDNAATIVGECQCQQAWRKILDQV